MILFSFDLSSYPFPLLVLTFKFFQIFIMSSHKSDVEHRVGYNSGEQHLGKSHVDSHQSSTQPQAGLHGQPDSHISGQSGPEMLGGSASTRVLGQSVNEQLHSSLPTTKN